MIETIGNWYINLWHNPTYAGWAIVVMGIIWLLFLILIVVKKK